MKLFGTDGIRGKPNEYPILPSIMTSIGHCLSFIWPYILIGKDDRESGNWIEQSLTIGIRPKGRVISVGKTTTPMMSFLCKKHNCYGIMITASHNGPEYNGIKIFNNKGQKLSKNIEKKIELMCNTKNYKSEYIDHIVDLFKDTKFYKGTTSHNELFKKIIKKLEITKVYTFEETLIFNFDSDCDRCKLNIGTTSFDGDDLLYNLYQPGDTVIGTDYTNTSLAEYIEKTGGKFFRTRTGDRNVTEMMREYDARLGGEPSGHIIVKGYSESPDAIITALLILSQRKIKKLPRKYTQKYANLPYKEDIITTEFEHKDARVVIRKSGTEPVLRVMVESKKNADKIMKKVLEKIK